MTYYVKSKCFGCGETVHLQIADDERLSAVKGELFERLCPACREKHLFEALGHASPVTPEQEAN